MGTGAETHEETKGGASQSRDVIPELLLSHAPTNRSTPTQRRSPHLPTWGQFFSNFKSDIWHIKYLIIQDQLQRWYMVHCTNQRIAMTRQCPVILLI